MKTPLCSYTYLAFTLNHLIETQPENDLSFHEIFNVACDHRLLELLIQRYGDVADFTGLFDSPIVNILEMEAALADAAAPFDGRGDRATAPLSGLCLVMDPGVHLSAPIFLPTCILSSSCRQCSYPPSGLPPVRLLAAATD